MKSPSSNISHDQLNSFNKLIKSNRENNKKFSDR